MTTKINKKYIEEFDRIYSSPIIASDVLYKSEPLNDEIKAFLIKTIDAVREENKKEIDHDSASWLDGYETGWAEGNSGGINKDGSLKSPITDREEGEGK